MGTSPLEESYGTLSETIHELVKQGYTYDFNTYQNLLSLFGDNAVLSPADFRIDKVYRFEGQSNPDDQSILYAISSPGYGLKGTLVNGYGISSDDGFSKIIEKLQTNDTDKA